MKVVINVILFLIACLLVYSLIGAIREPIAFRDQLQLREDAVDNQLKEIRKAQQIYRDVTGGSFASSWDSLKYVIQNGRIPIVSVFGDADDPNFDGEIRFDTSYVAAIDSARSLGVDLDDIEGVPYSDGKTFDLFADTLTYQSVLTNVVEVGTPYKSFMGEYADQRFSKYDDAYDVDKVKKFGSRSSPSLSGNWE